MKKKGMVLALVAAAALGVTAVAQEGYAPAYGYPGMGPMGGYGAGPMGGYGAGPMGGYGPGPMGGYGPGPMGGYGAGPMGGYGAGPMGGYGAGPMGGYGPGPMGGYGAGPMGGYGPGPMGGYGPGPMGGYGPGPMGGYGPGPMGGYGPGVLGDDGVPGPLGMLDLNAQQRKAIADLMGRQRSDQFERTARMRELEGKLRRLYAEPTWDADAIGNTYDQLFDLKRERIVSMVRGHNQVHGLLTEGQRRQLSAMTGGMGGRQGPMARGKGAAGQPKPPAAQQ